MPPDEHTDGLFGALGMYGTAHSLADRIAAPLPADFYDPEAFSSIEWIDSLTEAQRRHLRAILWRQGRIVFFDSFVVSAALAFPWLCHLGAALRLAEKYPDESQFGRSMTARVWRSWLRLRGLGHRIGQPGGAHGVRAHSRPEGQCSCGREDEPCE